MINGKKQNYAQILDICLTQFYHQQLSNSWTNNTCCT